MRTVVPSSVTLDDDPEAKMTIKTRLLGLTLFLLAGCVGPTRVASMADLRTQEGACAMASGSAWTADVCFRRGSPNQLDDDPNRSLMLVTMRSGSIDLATTSAYRFTVYQDGQLLHRGMGGDDVPSVGAYNQFRGIWVKELGGELGRGTYKVVITPSYNVAGAKTVEITVR